MVHVVIVEDLSGRNNRPGRLCQHHAVSSGLEKPGHDDKGRGSAFKRIGIILKLR